MPNRPTEQQRVGDDSSEPEENRGSFERVISERLKRIIGTSAKNVSADAVRQLVSELKLSKEALNNVFTQLDETKSGVYRAISREVRELVERTSLSDEIAKALSLLSLEVKMEVRFKPSASRDREEKPASVQFRVNNPGSQEAIEEKHKG